MPGELSSTLDALTRDVIEGARKVEREVEVPFSDGSTHLVRGTKFPVIDPDGRAIGLIQLITDITVEKEAEQHLRQAQKLDAIGQLTGGIAHDFNNLLMVIDGYARQALNRLGDTDAAEASIKEVLLGAERATTLTRQLLAFSRRQLMERRVFCIKENLQEIEGLLVRSIGELFDLAFDFPEHRLCIDTDPGEFTQAVVNLAVNARDAMPGGGAITVGFRERPMDDRFVEKFPDLRAARTVEVFVTDQGHGMDRETLRRVFEPFFTTKERGKGTGLGLAMVYGFAQQSGGAVDIVSAPGEGTTVSIVLPIANRLPDDVTEEMDEAWLGQNETILLVEDDTKVLGLTRYCLEELGYKVLTAGERRRRAGAGGGAWRHDRPRPLRRDHACDGWLRARRHNASAAAGQEIPVHVRLSGKRDGEGGRSTEERTVPAKTPENSPPGSGDPQRAGSRRGQAGWVASRMTPCVQVIGLKLRLSPEI